MTNFLGQFGWLLAAFLAGCAFTIFMFSATLKRQEARAQFPAALKQLALFLTLGIAGFSISVAVLQQINPGAEQGKTLVAAPAEDSTNQISKVNPTLHKASIIIPQSGPVTTSQLTKVRFPVAAQPVQESDIAKTSIQQLRAIVQGIDVNADVKNVEILMWEKSSLQKTNSASLSRDVQQQLQKQNYVYRQTNGQGGQGQGTTVREFVAINKEQKKIVPGFWMITSEFTLLCWGDFVPKQ